MMMRKRSIISTIMLSIYCLLTLTLFASPYVTYSQDDEREIEAAIGRLNASTVDERRDAARLLARVRTARSTEGLISALHNSDIDVRRAAVSALSARVKDASSKERTIEGLITALDNSDELVDCSKSNVIYRVAANYVFTGDF